MKNLNDYICDSCGNRVDDIFTENDEIVICPECNSNMRRKYAVGSTRVSVGKCGNASTSYGLK